MTLILTPHRLEEKQISDLKKLAETTPRVTVSEHIRRAIDNYLHDNVGQLIASARRISTPEDGAKPRKVL